MPSWGPFQPKLFYDSVKIRSINKNSFRLLQKWSGLWPTPVFQSQNLDSAMKMTDSPRVRDLYSIISWETTRSAEKMHFCTDIATCEGTDRCQPIESCAGSQTPCAVPLLDSQSPCILPSHPSPSIQPAILQLCRTNKALGLSLWQPGQLLSAAKIALHRAQGHEVS